MPVADPDIEAQFQAQQAGQGGQVASPPAQASGPADAATEALFEKQLAAQPIEAQAAGLADPSTTYDVARGTGTGLVKGTENLLGLPGSASQSLDRWTSYGLLKAAELASPYLPKSMQLPGTAEQAAQASYKLEKGGVPQGIAHGDLSMPTAEQMQGVGQAVTGPLPTPQTPYGQVAENVASFLPGAAAAPGNTLGQAIRNVIGYGVIPGIASEGAGRAAKTFLGDSWESVGRAAGALGGAVVGHGTAAPRPTDAILSGATRGVTDADIANAQALSQSSAGLGIPLSGPESVAAATGGKSNLPRFQRLLEGSPESGPIMSNFYAGRPAQVQAAGRTAFDTIAPSTSTPSMVGVQGQQAAEANLKAIQDHINTVTRPYYAAAENHVIPSADFDPIAKDPAFQASLAKLRNDPVLGPKYQGFPDNSVKVIDAATKDMGAQGTALANSANQGFQPEKSADFYSGAGSARDIARNPAMGGSSDYDAALLMQQNARQRLLEPQQAGPIGKIAGTSDTGMQGQILYPNAPQPGSQIETANAVRALEHMQPGLPAQLTRQHLESGFNNATQDNMTGPNQYGGAKFASTMFGHPQQAANTYAGLSALPNNPQLQSLIDALKATGFREPPGSQTAPTEMLNAKMSAGGAGQKLATALSPEKYLGGARDWYDKYRMGANKEDLANVMTSGPAFFDRLNAARTAIPPDQYRSMIVKSLLGRAAITPPALPAILQALRQPNDPNKEVGR